MSSRKLESIILRTDKSTHNLIKRKSLLFGTNKSDFLRISSLSYWRNSKDISSFKNLLLEYNNSDEKGKNEIVDLLFEYYRKTGFPYTELTDEEKINRLDRIIKARDLLLEGNFLQTNPSGLDLANYFHPHMIEIKSGYRNDRTPKETYEDDNCLRDCIKRWLFLGNTPNHSGIRRILKTRNGTRTVTNFRPTVAKFLYDTYVPDGGSILDPCSGFSGRLLGCISSGRGILYHGIDPDSRTAIGNMNCASFFSNYYDLLGERDYNYRFRFDLGCAEDVMSGIEGNYDVIFTSPPYFDLEKYNNNKNQSYNKFNNYEKWLKEFLFKIVDESKRLLKKEGKLILNTKNTDNYAIANDLCRYCSEKWVLEKEYKMKLVNSEYNRSKDKEINFHYEPIFVFVKK
ncbi:MAG TPA: DNA methyltransferase [Candidatus Paceibacterota bacterium]|nr:DNA methyltransferase [Candidatus Paceibacterota bacterium]